MGSWDKSVSQYLTIDGWFVSNGSRYGVGGWCDAGGDGTFRAAGSPAPTGASCIMWTFCRHPIISVGADLPWTPVGCCVRPEASKKILIFAGGDGTFRAAGSPAPTGASCVMWTFHRHQMISVGADLPWTPVGCCVRPEASKKILIFAGGDDTFRATGSPAPTGASCIMWTFCRHPIISVGADLPWTPVGCCVRPCIFSGRMIK
jgi:hypothetical protein